MNPLIVSTEGAFGSAEGATAAGRRAPCACLWRWAFAAVDRCEHIALVVAALWFKCGLTVADRMIVCVCMRIYFLIVRRVVRLPQLVAPDSVTPVLRRITGSCGTFIVCAVRCLLWGCAVSCFLRMLSQWACFRCLTCLCLHVQIHGRATLAAVYARSSLAGPGCATVV